VGETSPTSVRHPTGGVQNESTRAGQCLARLVPVPLPADRRDCNVRFPGPISAFDFRAQWQIRRLPVP